MFVSCKHLKKIVMVRVKVIVMVIVKVIVMVIVMVRTKRQILLE